MANKTEFLIKKINLKKLQEAEKKKTRESISFLSDFINRNKTENPSVKINISFLVQLCVDGNFNYHDTQILYAQLNYPLGKNFYFSKTIPSSQGRSYSKHDEADRVLHSAYTIYEYAKKLRKNKVI
jgi:hypothetical protein